MPIHNNNLPTICTSKFNPHSAIPSVCRLPAGQILVLPISTTVLPIGLSLSHSGSQSAVHVLVKCNQKSTQATELYNAFHIDHQSAPTHTQPPHIYIYCHQHHHFYLMMMMCLPGRSHPPPTTNP